MKLQLRNRRSGSKGAAIIEFALVLLPLMLMLIGMLDYGWYFYVDLAATNAAREGAREATLYAGNCPNGAGMSAARVRVLDYMSRIRMQNFTNVTTNCITDAHGPMLDVRVDVDFPRLTGASLVPMPTGSANNRTAVHTRAIMRGVVP